MDWLKRIFGNILFLRSPFTKSNYWKALFPFLLNNQNKKLFYRTLGDTLTYAAGRGMKRKSDKEDLHHGMATKIRLLIIQDDGHLQLRPL